MLFQWVSRANICRMRLSHGDANAGVKPLAAARRGHPVETIWKGAELEGHRLTLTLTPVRKLGQTLMPVLVAGAFAVGAFAVSGASHAAKGDLRVPVRTHSPLLQGKALDLRFAGFAQGIWVRSLQSCPVERIERTEPGSTLAIFRGLLETPAKICQVYGAERDNPERQRAALNCLLNDGGEVIELVTLRPRGTGGLMVQMGEQPPVHFRFCERIIPALEAVHRD